VFSKLTGGKHDAAHPDISTARWIQNYVGGAGEHDRLGRAMQLDREAALKAASWGKFQILGMNYSRVGSRTVDEFVEAQKRSEKEHLAAFVKFILSHDLSDELRDRRWADFARRYNGPRYAENRYDQKMAEAYARYA
jgi:N-acetylmuramidase